MAKALTKARKKKHKVVIDRETCKGCYLCIHVCKTENIKIAKKLNVKGYHPAEFGTVSKCTGCAQCVLVCPEMAIEVYDEE